MRGAEYAELAAFVAVTRDRSFRKASVRLGVSPSAVSQAVRLLEDRLGAKLLNRTTRSLAPTDAGRRLFNQLEPAFANISGAVDSVRALQDRPSGTVRINLPRLAAELTLATTFGAFQRAYPDVHLELTVDDGLTDIVASGFDAGIRLMDQVQKDMVAVRVTQDLRVAVVGSPAYFETRQPPRLPQDLKDHACINYRWAATGALYKWAFAKGGTRVEVPVTGTVTLNDSALIVSAALAGAGLGSSLEAYVRPHLETGRLIRVLEDWCPPLNGFYLYYPSRKQMPAALRALVDFLHVTQG